jgi:hypothetical protein
MTASTRSRFGSCRLPRKSRQTWSFANCSSLFSMKLFIFLPLVLVYTRVEPKKFRSASRPDFNAPASKFAQVCLSRHCLRASAGETVLTERREPSPRAGRRVAAGCFLITPAKSGRSHPSSRFCLATAARNASRTPALPSRHNARRTPAESSLPSARRCQNCHPTRDSGIESDDASGHR